MSFLLHVIIHFAFSFPLSTKIGQRKRVYVQVLNYCMLKPTFKDDILPLFLCNKHVTLHKMLLCIENVAYIVRRLYKFHEHQVYIFFLQ